MTPILEVANIEKYYGNKGNLTKAVDRVSFQVETGEFIGIMGPSGSGKTTLLNCIATIDTVTSGHIRINNKDITALKKNSLSQFRREELGFIFQDFNLLDTLTAYENIALALTIQKKKPSEIKQQVMSVAEKLDIVDVLQKYPYQMSGGQKQRVASARALVTNPSLILADEPTGALNQANTREVLGLLTDLNREGQSILMVTHDLRAAARGNRVLYLEDGKVCDELALEPYNEMEEKQRERDVSQWLSRLRW